MRKVDIVKVPMLEGGVVQDIEYNLNTGVIKYTKYGKPRYIYLTKTQKIVFRILVTNGESTSTRAELFNAIYGTTVMNRQDDKVLNLIMYRLKVALKPVAFVICQKKVGYIIKFKGAKEND